jgi:hypothetical protein
MKAKRQTTRRVLGTGVQTMVLISLLRRIGLRRASRLAMLASSAYLEERRRGGHSRRPLRSSRSHGL